VINGELLMFCQIPDFSREHTVLPDPNVARLDFSYSYGNNNNIVQCTNAVQKLTEFVKNCKKDTSCGFKVIWWHRICHQSKGHMWLPMSG